jgi:hypothetical protein
MSFGKRGLPSPPPPDRPRVPVTPQSSVLLQQLRGIGTGVALALGIYLAYYVGMRSLGRALDASWSAGDGVEWTAIVPSSDSALGAAERSLRDICLQLHPIHTKRPLPESVRFDFELGGSRERQLTTVASFLACSTEQQQQRLCQAGERAKLVDQIKRYLKFRGTIVSGQAATGLPRDTEWRMQQITTRPASEGAHERLLRGLNQLAERGCLSSSDFGFFGFGVPKDLVPRVKVEAKTRSCQ